MAKFVFRTPVSLNDPTYFCNKSWTVSYNMNTKSWISFHSYIPNFYIAENNFFYSGQNACCTDIDFIAGVVEDTTTTTTTAMPDCSMGDGTLIEITTTSTTSTTTSTSTSTTTTTTTTAYVGPVGQFLVAAESAGIQIDNITINAVSVPVTPDYPILSVESPRFPQLGVVTGSTLVVTVSGTGIPSLVWVWDNINPVQIQVYTGTGDYTFLGVDTANGTILDVHIIEDPGTTTTTTTTTSL